MDGLFEFNTFVTGKKFLGRKDECKALAEAICKGENILLMEPPKSGKMSLIKQTALDLKQIGVDALICTFDMTGIRTIRDFVPGLKATVEKFGLQQASSAESICDLLRIPFKAAEIKGRPTVLVFSEFQNIAFLDESEQVLRDFKTVLMDERQESRCSFIFSGSRVNAMKDIFCKGHFLAGGTRQIRLGKIPERELVDHVYRGFMMGGKEIGKQMILDKVRMFDCNAWHINTFFAICDAYTRGYITPTVEADALSSVIAIHSPHYQAIVSTLTGFQITLLRAIIQGETQFSAASAIEKYGFNSSANVKRIKDALCKKEVISFDENKCAYILDPFFKYWLEKFYFKTYGQL